MQKSEKDDPPGGVSLQSDDTTWSYAPYLIGKAQAVVCPFPRNPESTDNPDTENSEDLCHIRAREDMSSPDGEGNESLIICESGSDPKQDESVNKVTMDDGSEKLRIQDDSLLDKLESFNNYSLSQTFTLHQSFQAILSDIKQQEMIANGEQPTQPITQQHPDVQVIKNPEQEPADGSSQHEQPKTSFQDSNHTTQLVYANDPKFSSIIQKALLASGIPTDMSEEDPQESIIQSTEKESPKCASEISGPRNPKRKRESPTEVRPIAIVKSEQASDVTGPEGVQQMADHQDSRSKDFQLGHKDIVPGRQFKHPENPLVLNLTRPIKEEALKQQQPESGSPKDLQVVPEAQVGLQPKLQSWQQFMSKYLPNHSNVPNTTTTKPSISVTEHVLQPTSTGQHGGFPARPTSAIGLTLGLTNLHSRPAGLPIQPHNGNKLGIHSHVPNIPARLPDQHHLEQSKLSQYQPGHSSISGLQQEQQKSPKSSSEQPVSSQPYQPHLVPSQSGQANMSSQNTTGANHPSNIQEILPGKTDASEEHTSKSGDRPEKPTNTEIQSQVAASPKNLTSSKEPVLKMPHFGITPLSESTPKLDHHISRTKLSPLIGINGLPETTPELQRTLKRVALTASPTNPQNAGILAESTPESHLHNIKSKLSPNNFQEFTGRLSPFNDPFYLPPPAHQNQHRQTSPNNLRQLSPSGYLGMPHPAPAHHPMEMYYGAPNPYQQFYGGMYGNPYQHSFHQPPNMMYQYGGHQQMPPPFGLPLTYSQPSTQQQEMPHEKNSSNEEKTDRERFDNNFEFPSYLPQEATKQTTGSEQKDTEITKNDQYGGSNQDELDGNPQNHSKHFNTAQSDQARLDSNSNQNDPQANHWSHPGIHKPTPRLGLSLPVQLPGVPKSIDTLSGQDTLPKQNQQHLDHKPTPESHHDQLNPMPMDYTGQSLQERHDLQSQPAHGQSVQPNTSISQDAQHGFHMHHGLIPSHPQHPLNPVQSSRPHLQNNQIGSHPQHHPGPSHPFHGLNQANGSSTSNQGIRPTQHTHGVPTDPHGSQALHPSSQMSHPSQRHQLQGAPQNGQQRSTTPQHFIPRLPTMHGALPHQLHDGHQPLPIRPGSAHQPVLNRPENAHQQNLNVYNPHQSSNDPRTQSNTHSEVSSTGNDSQDSIPDEAPIVSLPPGNKRKGRINYTNKQLNAMDRAFEENPYPKPEILDNLSAFLEIPVSKLKVWFQNKRARARKKGGDKAIPQPEKVDQVYKNLMSFRKIPQTTEPNFQNFNPNPNPNIAHQAMSSHQFHHLQPPPLAGLLPNLKSEKSQ